MLKTLTAPAMCTRCGEPYVAALRPRPLVSVDAPAFGTQAVGGRLMVIDDTVCLIERHTPCTGFGNYR